MRKISLFFSIYIWSFILCSYSALTIYSLKYCERRSTLNCSIVSKLTYPGHFLLDGYTNTKRLITKLTSSNSTSGLIAKKPIVTKSRFLSLKPGFNFNYKAGSRKSAGFLLLSRAKPADNAKPLIELWDINKQVKLHEYNFDLNDIQERSGIQFTNTERFRHPLLLEDGAIIFVIEGSGLIKLDKCGRYLASNSDFNFHHSIEIDDLGKIYVPTRQKIKDIDHKIHSKTFAEEGFAILDQDLNIQKTFSLLEIYRSNNLLADIYGRNMGFDDPFHLNDVQPLITENGDVIVLLSIRNQSSLMAFNIKNEKIVWKIERATTLQHDIDILSFSDELIDIAIFDNNTRLYLSPLNLGNKIVSMRNLPTSNKNGYLLLADDFTHSKYDINRISFDWFDKPYVPNTLWEGGFEYVFNNNSLMVEETTHGRLFEVEITTGDILWQYVNKSSYNSAPYYLSWSRRMDELPGNLNKSSFNSCIPDS